MATLLLATFEWQNEEMLLLTADSKIRVSLGMHFFIKKDKYVN